jgi:L-asparaginase
MQRILLLHTGGTLGMAGGRPSALKPSSFFRTLMARAPELFELAHVELELFSNNDSCEMQPELWTQIGEHLAQRLPEFDGAVVTHGTDTLAYTASALSFMLQGLKKPVVLTGSQRPLGEIRSDARLNLIDAVTAAVRGPSEVTLCFDSHLYRGNRAQKIAVAEYDCFASPNFPPLGVLGVEATFQQGLPPAKSFRLRQKLDPRVFMLKVFPGLDPSLARKLLPHVRGLCIEAYGAGNFPIQEKLGRSLLPLLTEAREREIPVVIVSQAFRNGVDLTLYEAGAAALELGAIPGGDLTPSAAVVKLMHALAYCKSVAEVRKTMQTPIAGELTVVAAARRGRRAAKA